MCSFVSTDTDKQISLYIYIYLFSLLIYISWYLFIFPIFVLFSIMTQVFFITLSLNLYQGQNWRDSTDKYHSLTPVNAILFANSQYQSTSKTDWYMLGLENTDTPPPPKK